MKHIFSFFTCIFSWLFVSSQIGQWTWMSGDSTGNHVEVYGVKQVPDPANNPGALNPANTWTDKAGNLWMFGGIAQIAVQNYAETIPVPSNTLWKYDLVQNAWLWLTGENGRTPSDYGEGHYGTKGVPAVDNTPPQIRRGSVSWIDASGNLWLFGGKVGYRNFGTKGDMWKFDPSINQWTWIRGEGTNEAAGNPSYGTKGVPDSSNTPGARSLMVNWKDREGNFYIYGGYREFTFSTYIDFWKYDHSKDLWTWISGEKLNNNLSTSPVYGSKGISSIDNTPGSIEFRNDFAVWSDPQGRFWMYIFNEFWNYSIETHQWTWMDGDRNVQSQRVYGIKGVPSANNHPGIRDGTFKWTDSVGNLWLLGGSLQEEGGKNLNDLWKYTLATGQWTWMDGDSSTNRHPDYGVKGVPSVINHPGGRSGSKAWIDAEGNFWLYGGGRQNPEPGMGNTSLFLNDIWKFQFFKSDIIVPARFTSFSAAQRDKQVYLDWSISHEHNSKEIHIQHSTDGIHFTTIGTVATDGNASTVFHYQFVDKTPANGNNYYRLKLVGRDDTFTYSAIVQVPIEMDGFVVGIIQNPVQHELRLALQLDKPGVLQIRVKDAVGRLHILENKSFPQGRSTYSIAVNRLAGGTYIISIAKDRKIITKRFFKS